MSKETRQVTIQGVTTTFKSTREVAIESAHRLPNGPPATNAEEYAKRLIGQARLIEAYLDESD